MQTLFLAIFSRVVSIAEAQAITEPVKPGKQDACAKSRYYQWPCA